MTSNIVHKRKHRPEISGVILAGGRGTRMGGEDKGLLQIQGQPMVVRICEALRPQVDVLYINANRNQGRYADLTGLPVIPDQQGHFAGPLAGIAAALDYSASPYLAAVPCDSPFLAGDLVPRLYSALQKQAADIAMASSGGRLQPVFVLLARRLLPSLLEFLSGGGRKIIYWYYQHRVVEVDFSDHRRMFENINTPQERQRIERDIAFSP